MSSFAGGVSLELNLGRSAWVVVGQRGLVIFKSNFALRHLMLIGLWPLARKANRRLQVFLGAINIASASNSFSLQIRIPSYPGQAPTKPVGIGEVIICDRMLISLQLKSFKRW